MPIYHYLEHAIRIMREQRDYRLWGPMIGALPDAAQAECRPWLREEARKRQLFDRVRP